MIPKIKKNFRNNKKVQKRLKRKKREKLTLLKFTNNLYLDIFDELYKIT